MSYAVVARCGQAHQEIRLHERNQEFEGYANVEILEFIHVCIANCQTEEGPMRTMNSYRLTIFHGVKAEVAGFETEPNEESMEHGQACGSIPCGCARESRYQQRLRQALRFTSVALSLVVSRAEP